MSVIGFGTVGVTGSGMSFELHDDGSSELAVWMASGARASLELSAADTAALAMHLAPAAPLPADAVAPEPVNTAPAEAEPVEETAPAEEEPEA